MNGRERMRRTAILVTLVVALGMAHEASAQPGASKAAADALFAEGRTLMDQHKYAEACAKFAESERFEAAVGTSLNLGECHEKLGHTASAYGAFGEAKRLAALRKDAEREAHAAERRAAIEPQLSRIMLRVPSDVTSMKLFLDGQELGPGAFGSAIPVDPGSHRVRGTAPDKLAFDKEVTVGAGPVMVEVNVKFPGDKPAADAWSTMRSVGVVVGAAGFVGVLGGGGFGVAAIVKNNASKDECRTADTTLCSMRGVSLRNQAGTFADVSTGTLVAGGVLVGLGVGLFVLGGSPGREKPGPAAFRVLPVLSPGFGGAIVGTEF